MIKESIDLLGMRAVDKVSGFEGVISTVGFDLYGCVQIILAPKVNADGKVEDSRWFDIQRLTVTEGERVMPMPDFKAMARKPAEYRHGATEKPAMRTH